MLDLKWLRQDAEGVRTRLAVRGKPEETGGAILADRPLIR